MTQPVQPMAQPVQPMAQPVQPMTQPVQPMYQPVATAPTTFGSGKEKKRKKGFVWILLLCAVLVVAVVLGVLFSNGNTPDDDTEGGKTNGKSVEDVAIMAVEASLTGDNQTLFDLCASDAEAQAIDLLTEYYEEDEYFEMVSDETGEDVKNWDDVWELAYKENLNSMGDPEISSEVISKEKMDEDELEEFRDGFADVYDGYYDEDLLADMSEGYVVEVEVTLDDDTESCTVYVIKWDGEWKLGRIGSF